MGATLLGVCGIGMGAAPPALRPATGPREFEVEGFRVRVDVAPKVIAIDVPEDVSYAERAGTKRVDVPLTSTIPVTGGERMVSEALLAQKGKQFDDGLYAAVELAAQRRGGTVRWKGGPADPAGTGRGRRPRRLRQRRYGDLGGVSPGAVAGGDAEKHGRGRGVGPGDLPRRRMRSKPIAFYTWSAPLSRISPSRSDAPDRAEGGGGHCSRGAGPPGRPVRATGV